MAKDSSFEREALWKEGMHLNSKGQKVFLSELPTQYLKNIANKYGEDHDVSDLQKEINSRPQDE